MYLLAHCNYDWYKWEDACCISDSKERLFAKALNKDSNLPVVFFEEIEADDYEKKFEDLEITHWLIRKIEVI